MELREKIKNGLSRFKEVSKTDSITRSKIDISINEALVYICEIGKGFAKNFSIDSDNKFVYENLVKWVNGDDSMQAINPTTKEIVRGRTNAGIYIAGSTGTGKTMCLDIIKVYAKIIGAKVHFKGEEEARKLTWSNVNALQIAKTYQQYGDIAENEKKRILCIQDFGCEQEKTMYMGNSSNVLRELIERRGDECGNILLLTSNLPMSHDLTIEKYGDRAVSRLCQMCNYFEMKGKDRRR